MPKQQPARPTAHTELQQDVEQVLASYPANARKKLLALRQLIYNVAATIDGVGEPQETTKWGQPAYLTPASRSGTTVRIAWDANEPEHISLFVHCQTTLIDTYRSLFPELECIGNRQVRLAVSETIPDCLSECVAMALTYKKPQLLGRSATQRA